MPEPYAANACGSGASTTSTAVHPQWRKINGEMVKTFVPRIDYPLYVRRNGRSWGVYHAASGMRIRNLRLQRDAVRYLFAIANIVDWAQPAGVLALIAGLPASLDAALPAAQPAHRILTVKPPLSGEES